MSRDMGRDRTQEVVGSSPISSTSKATREIAFASSGVHHTFAACTS